MDKFGFIGGERMDDPRMDRQYLTTAQELGSGPFWKVLKNDLIHHGFKYTIGQNVDTEPWNPSGTCSQGGLYFADTLCAFTYLSRGTKIGRVTLDPDEPVWVEEEGEIVKYKAHKIHLGDVAAIGEWSMWEDYDACLAAVSQNAKHLKHVKKQTPEICLAAVGQNGWTLKYVHEQTPEICLAAVTNNCMALQYVRNQTLEICLAAVQQDGWALAHVVHETPEICLAAVRQYGMVLERINPQTQELCLAAVTQTGLALKLVKNPTPEICSAAVNRAKYAREFVQDNDTKTKLS